MSFNRHQFWLVPLGLKGSESDQIRFLMLVLDVGEELKMVMFHGRRLYRNRRIQGRRFTSCQCGSFRWLG